jgi:DNA primase
VSPARRPAGLSPIEAARNRHRLADVAARTGIWLPRTGGDVTVACPLPSHGHPDRSPSMRLHLDRSRYHCFGCGAHGDVVQWVSDAEHLGVLDAITHLDRRLPITNTWAGNSGAGYPPSASASGIAERPDPDRTPVAALHDAFTAAWDHYTSSVRHRLGVDYLAGRRIDVACLEAVTGRAEVGHTRPGAAALVTALRRQGVTDDTMIDAGLARRYPDRPDLRDAYRQRVLLPVRNADGQVIGLLGRNVGDPRWPKYLNPPRTAIYDKSRDLYQPLPGPTRPGAHVIVVEGPLDALAIATTAISADLGDRYCPLTQSGRQLSATQARYVRSLDRHPILAFDADAAGRDSTTRIGALLAFAGCQAHVAALPDSEDPASWLGLHGVDGLRFLTCFSDRRAGTRRAAPDAFASATQARSAHDAMVPSTPSL